MPQGEHNVDDRACDYVLPNPRISIMIHEQIISQRCKKDNVFLGVTVVESNLLSGNTKNHMPDRN